jgi:hypothetical protein
VRTDKEMFLQSAEQHALPIFFAYGDIAQKNAV